MITANSYRLYGWKVGPAHISDAISESAVPRDASEDASGSLLKNIAMDIPEGSRLQAYRENTIVLPTSHCTVMAILTRETVLQKENPNASQQSLPESQPSFLKFRELVDDRLTFGSKMLLKMWFGILPTTTIEPAMLHPDILHKSGRGFVDLFTQIATHMGPINITDVMILFRLQQSDKGLTKTLHLLQYSVQLHLQFPLQFGVVQARTLFGITWNRDIIHQSWGIPTYDDVLDYHVFFGYQDLMMLEFTLKDEIKYMKKQHFMHMTRVGEILYEDWVHNMGLDANMVKMLKLNWADVVSLQWPLDKASVDLKINKK